MSGLAYCLRGIALALLTILLYGNQNLLEREGGGWQTLSLSMVQPLRTQEGNSGETLMGNLSPCEKTSGKSLACGNHRKLDQLIA